MLKFSEEMIIWAFLEFLNEPVSNVDCHTNVDSFGGDPPLLDGHGISQCATSFRNSFTHGPPTVLSTWSCLSDKVATCVDYTGMNAHAGACTHACMSRHSARGDYYITAVSGHASGGD